MYTAYNHTQYSKVEDKKHTNNIRTVIDYV